MPHAIRQSAPILMLGESLLAGVGVTLCRVDVRGLPPNDGAEGVHCR